MPVTLENLYRDINSRLSSRNISQERIYHTDVVKAINDAIASIRIQYISNGQGHEFIETEVLDTPVVDTTYPFVPRVYNLTKPLYRSLPISQAVRVSSIAKSSEFVLDQAQTFAKGDLVIKGDTLYRVANTVTNINVFDLTFSAGDIRFVAPTIKAFVGDVFFSEGKFYKANGSHTFQAGDDIANLASFDEVFLKRIGQAYEDAMYIPFSSIHQLKLSNDIQYSYPFTIHENKVYSSTENPFVIGYIPEWEYVTDLSTDIKIPDTMIPQVKQQAMRSLLIKLGGSLPETQED